MEVRLGSETAAVPLRGAGADRSRPSATTGKMSTDSRPAQTSAAAVIGVINPAAIPIWLAVTMNGRDVACSSPDAAERVLPSRTDR